MIDDPELHDSQEELADQRHLKYVQKFWQQPMAPGKGRNGEPIDGVWLKLPTNPEPIYINQEPHIKRLLLEHGGQVVHDPRPGSKRHSLRTIDGVPGPAATPPEDPEHRRKVEVLEQEVASIKEGMSQILALLQAPQSDAQKAKK